MQKYILILLNILLLTACPRRTPSDTVPLDTYKQESTKTNDEQFIELGDTWISSVKGHINPGSMINNEVNEMWIDITWTPEKGKGKVELVPAMRFDEKTGRYIDIHTNEPLAEKYDTYEDNMWYFQIDAPYDVVEPLLLEYYYDARFVYEGDLDSDGIPDFGILLKRVSNCCAYALLTIKDGQWSLIEYPYGISYNLRASGKELARQGARKGEIIITQSDYSDYTNSNCWEAPIKDSVILSKRIDVKDYFQDEE